MAWTAPSTVVAGTLITASWGNSIVRDDLLHLYNNRTIFDTLTRFNATISPTSLSANANDWNPTGLATCNVIRISATAGWDITGIAAQAAGTFILMVNVSNNLLGIRNESGSSAAANRFGNPASLDPLPLSSGELMLIWRDDSSNRWRTFASANA